MQSKVPFNSKQIFLFIAINFLLALFFLPMGYETNDDIGMELAYSGYYSGAPESGSLYNHFILGWLIKTLYGATKQLNWYGLIHIGVLYVSILLMVWNTSKKGWEFDQVFWTIILIILGFIGFAIEINFATVAFMAGFTGIYYYVDNAWSPKSISCWVAMMLILASILIRQHFFLLAGLMNIPILLRHSLIDRKTLAIKLLLVSALYLVLQWSNQWHYSTPGPWAECHRKYQALQYILDNPCMNMYYLRPHLKSVNWTENDYLLFKNFHFELPGNFSTEKIQKINKVIPRDMLDVDELLQSLFKFIPLYLLLGLLLIFIYSSIRFGTWQMLMNLTYIILILMFLMYLSGNKNILKERMLIPIYIGLCTFFLNPFVVNQKKKPNNNYRVFLLLAPFLFSVMARMHKVNLLQEELEIMNGHLNIRYAKQQVFEFYFYYPVCGFDSRIPSERQLPKSPFIPGGWLINTPLGKQRLQRLGADSLHEIILKRTTIHLIPKVFAEDYKRMIKMYFKQYWSMDIGFSTLEVFNSNLQSWEVLKINP